VREDRKENARLIKLLLLLGGFTFDGSLLGLFVERRQLTLFAEDSQKLNDEREIVVLAADVLDLK
jgi:hypothetical protein